MREPTGGERTALIHVMSFLIYHYNTDFPEFFAAVWGKPKESVHPDYYEEKLQLWREGPHWIWNSLDYEHRINWIVAADAKYGHDCEQHERIEFNYFVKGVQP